MKKALVLLAEGFEEIEALTVIDILRRANVECHSASIKDKYVSGAHNIKVEADFTLQDLDYKNYDCVILPGGMPGSSNLAEDNRVIRIVKEFYEEKKMVAAICAAPMVLGKAGILKGKNVTCYPGCEGNLNGGNYNPSIVLVDDNIITSSGPATAMHFALKLVELLCEKGLSEEIKEGLLLNFVLRES